MSADPGLTMLLLAGALVLALAGIVVFVAGMTQGRSLADRSVRAKPDSLSSRFAASADRRLRRSEVGRRLAQWLAGSGVAIAPSTFVAACLLAMLTGYLVTGLIFPVSLALFCGLCCAGACFAWVGRQRAQRSFAFIAQLPEIARLLGNGAQAGLSLGRAVERAADELDEPAASELGHVVAELRLGRSLDDALLRLRDRLPSREVGVLMSTLIIQQRAGGDTVRALQDISETLEARKDTLREVRTLMAGAVFTSYVVMAMGIGTIFLMNVLSPGVLDKMLGSLAGIAAMSVAAALYGVAFVLIRTTTKIEL